MEGGRICSLSWDMHLLLLWDIGVPGSQAFRLLAFRVFQLTDSRLWDFSVVILVWANPLINVLIYKEFGSVSVENRGQIRDITARPLKYGWVAILSVAGTNLFSSLNIFALWPMANSWYKSHFQTETISLKMEERVIFMYKHIISRKIYNGEEWGVWRLRSLNI